MKKLLALVPVCLLAGCSTPYQDVGMFSLTGGFYETSGAGKMEKISFGGNGYTNAKTVEQYTLYRCAEMAKAKNKSHFVMYGTLVEAAMKLPTDVPTIGMVGGKPIGFAFVLFLDAPQPGAKDTDKVLAELAPIVKPGAAPKKT